LARDLEACVLKERDHRCAVGDQARVNLVVECANDDLTGFGAVGTLAHQFEVAGKVRLHRVGPAVGLVQHVAQCAERGFMAGRCDVQCPPRRQLQTRCAEMQLDVPFVHVTHPKAVVLIRLKPRKGQSLK
jgi:hypothetical protein